MLLFGAILLAISRLGTAEAKDTHWTVVHAFAADFSTVWTATLQVLAENDWKPTIMDRQSGLIVTDPIPMESAKVKRELAGCGETRWGEELLLTEVRANILIRPDADSTRISLTVILKGQLGASCITTGDFERRFFERLDAIAEMGPVALMTPIVIDSRNTDIKTPRVNVFADHTTGSADAVSLSIELTKLECRRITDDDDPFNTTDEVYYAIGGFDPRGSLAATGPATLEGWWSLGPTDPTPPPEMLYTTTLQNHESVGFDLFFMEADSDPKAAREALQLAGEAALQSGEPIVMAAGGVAVVVSQIWSQFENDDDYLGGMRISAVNDEGRLDSFRFTAGIDHTVHEGDPAGAATHAFTIRGDGSEYYLEFVIRHSGRRD